MAQNRKEYKVLLVSAFVGIAWNKVAHRIDRNTTNKKDIMVILVSKAVTEMMRKWQEKWKVDNKCLYFGVH